MMRSPESDSVPGQQCTGTKGAGHRRRGEQWAWWFEAAGLSAPISPAGEVVFENSAMAMQAVLDGVGVAIAQLP